ncbi:MAG TPA: FUSC family protein, partial [Acidisoma sp.]|nr:FUSC family protein [Acidisoma sp.]
MRGGVRAALGCGVPLLLAARWSEPGLAWAALIAFWVVPTDPEWPGPRRFAMIAGFILASALGAFLGVQLRPHLAVATLFAGLWCFIAVFARVLGSAAASVGGMAAVVLLIVIGLQQPSSLAAAWSIAGTTLAGGIWGLVLALLIGRRGLAGAPPAIASTRPWISTVRSNLTWQSLSLRHAARFAIMAAGLTALIRALHLLHSHWVTLAAVIVLQTYPSATWRRAVERLAGTIGGGAIAAAAALILH